MFIYRQGKTAPVAEPDLDLTEAELDVLRIQSDTGHGPLRHLGPVLELSETKPHWVRPTPILGGDTPEWPAAVAEAAE